MDQMSAASAFWAATRARLGPPTQPPTAEYITAYMVYLLAQVVNVDPYQIDTREPFANYGLDSVGAVSLLSDLEELVGRPLEPTMVWDYPSVDQLAQYLTSQVTPH